MSGEIRLPLVELSDEKKKVLASVLSQFELN
jgi:dihydrodipicolinate synthase/N-acetylneuraminate lyase